MHNTGMAAGQLSIRNPIASKFTWPGLQLLQYSRVTLVPSDHCDSARTDNHSHSSVPYNRVNLLIATAGSDVKQDQILMTRPK